MMMNNFSTSGGLKTALKAPKQSDGQIKDKNYKDGLIDNQRDRYIDGQIWIYEIMKAMSPSDYCQIGFVGTQVLFQKGKVPGYYAHR